MRLTTPLAVRAFAQAKFALSIQLAQSCVSFRLVRRIEDCDATVLTFAVLSTIHGLRVRELLSARGRRPTSTQKIVLTPSSGGPQDRFRAKLFRRRPQRAPPDPLSAGQTRGRRARSHNEK